MPNRVLIVDDDPDVLEVVHATLTVEGFIATTAGSSTDAIRLIESQRPDLIILDVMMETRDAGFRLCRQLVSNYDIPIIFLTARATDIDAIVGLELGADDYITKPFNPRLLASRVRTVLRRASQPPSTGTGEAARLEFGEFIVDESRSCVEAPGGERPLSRMELMILRTIGANVGAVFSRANIIEQVYSPEDSPSPRTVDSHVRRLRKKLNEIGTDPIETVWGVGYKLRDDSGSDR